MRKVNHRLLQTFLGKLDMDVIEGGSLEMAKHV